MEYGKVSTNKYTNSNNKLAFKCYSRVEIVMPNLPLNKNVLPI